jgi:hypothetical protein
MAQPFQTQTIFHIYSGEGFFTPAVNDGHILTPEQKADEALFKAARVPETWDPQRWVLHWRRFNRAKQKPDWDEYCQTPMCSAQTAQRLWSDGPSSGLTLLPITVGGEPWFFVVCTLLVAVDAASSSVFYGSSPEEQVRTTKASAAGEAAFRAYLDAMVQYEMIVNVTDPAVAELDLFWVVNPHYPDHVWAVHCTERFKSRCEALGLKGMTFRPVGYIVDGPANVVIPKKLEPPKRELPRWTQAREANPESLQELKQAGQHWYAQQGFGADTDGLTIVRAIEAVVQHHGDNQHKLKKAAWAQLGLELQGAWGLLLERDLGWQWLEVAVGRRTYALAVQTPNGSHAHCLSQVLAKQFRRAPETTLELTYNMLKTGNLPPGDAGQRVCLG